MAQNLIIDFIKQPPLAKEYSDFLKTQQDNYETGEQVGISQAFKYCTL